MNPAPDCIFCAIVAGHAPAHRVYEDDRILIFMDLFPAHEGHTLIIPKRHGKNLFEVHSEDLAAVIRQSVPLGRALEDGLARRRTLDDLARVALDHGRASRSRRRRTRRPWRGLPTTPGPSPTAGPDN